MERRLYFVLGDLLVNAIAGVAAAFSAGLVPPSWHPLVAMPLGMCVGAASASVVALLFMPFFGAFEVMLPAMLTGMVAGKASGGSLELRQMDVESLEMPDGSFDQAFTSCTFCSVTRPVEGLREIFRVLKPGGDLYMFEHTGSRYFPFNLMLDAMTPLSRRVGPDLNRPTVENVTRSGFELRDVRNYFLDVVKTIYATRPAAAAQPSTGKASSFSR